MKPYDFLFFVLLANYTTGTHIKNKVASSFTKPEPFLTIVQEPFFSLYSTLSTSVRLSPELWNKINEICFLGNHKECDQNRPKMQVIL